MEPKKEEFISGNTKKVLQKELAQLQRAVSIVAVLSDKQNKPFNDFCEKLLTELSSLTDKIRPVIVAPDSETAKKYQITRSPTLLIEPEQYAIRFTGAPAGEEARTFLLAVIMASAGITMLSDASKKRLSELKENRNLKVFVSPSCPYCPQQALQAVCAAIEMKDLISTEIIEIYENKDLATEYNAFSVPQLFINDQLVGTGLQPEEVFVEEVLTAAPIEIKPFEGGGIVGKDLVIVGAGPAGLTAAIYAARSGMDTVVLEKGNIGGQVAITPVVENYPGFTRIGGKTLMDMMAQQAIQYTDIHQGEEVLDIQKTDNLLEIRTNRAAYKAKALLISAGAESKKLNVPGEKEFQGRGVSYCASCDGYFFKDGKKVFVIGGGNTAATEALYLKNIGVDVTIVHRRDRLRAEKFLQDSLAANNIPVIWNTKVTEIKGEKFVNSIVLEKVTDASTSTLLIDGVFIAIGYVPSNELAKKLGVETDGEGYIRIDKGYRTNVIGVYAAGDITGGFKQIVTAVGQGATAAATIFEDISARSEKQVS
jgi:thioredoxin reductase (NADPH)